MATPSKAEIYSHLIRAAIQRARADGVHVSIDWFEDDDGMHARLVTRDDPTAWAAQWIVEGY